MLNIRTSKITFNTNDDNNDDDHDDTPLTPDLFIILVGHVVVNSFFFNLRFFLCEPLLLFSHSIFFLQCSLFIKITNYYYCCYKFVGSIHCFNHKIVHLNSFFFRSFLFGSVLVLLNFRVCTISIALQFIFLFFCSVIFYLLQFNIQFSKEEHRRIFRTTK